MSEASGRLDPPQALQLARVIAELQDTAVSGRAVWRARVAIVDAVATILAGAAAPGSRALLSTPGLCSGAGEALVFGTKRRTSALDACLLNTSAYTAREAVPESVVLGGRSSGALVAALFALGEERKATGRQVLVAYAAGSELARRLSLPREVCTLAEGVVATLAVAGASAQLLRLDEQRIVTALVLGATLSSGIDVSSMPLHHGLCARHGLLAAMLAEQGFVVGAVAVDAATRVLGRVEAEFPSGAGATEDPDNTWLDAMWDKFCQCAGLSLPSAQVAPLFECLETLETADDLGRVTRLAELSSLHETRDASGAISAPASADWAQQDPRPASADWAQQDPSWVP